MIHYGHLGCPFYSMKQLLLLPLLLATTLPAYAGYGQRGYSQQCFEDVYREEYIPGTRTRPGRVRRWTEQKEVPCNYDGYRGGMVPHHHTNTHYDDNSCVEGSVLGGLAGAAIGGASATQENWIWSIPAGIVGGALVGCQLDGG